MPSKPDPAYGRYQLLVKTLDGKAAVKAVGGSKENLLWLAVMTRYLPGHFTVEEKPELCLGDVIEWEW